MDMTTKQIDARHQGHGAVPLILVIAHHGRATARQWRQIRRGRADRLDAGLLVVGDDGEAPIHALAGACRALPVLAQHPGAADIASD